MDFQNIYIFFRLFIVIFLSNLKKVLVFTKFLEKQAKKAFSGILWKILTKSPPQN